LRSFRSPIITKNSRGLFSNRIVFVAIVNVFYDF